MSVKLVVVGSVAYDSLKTPKGSRESALGGAAMYGSTVASYFTEVGLVGVAGNDFEAADLEFLKQHGIDLSGFTIDKSGKTFRWSGSYGEDFGDAATHETCLNVFESFNPTLPESYKNAELLFLANIHPGLQINVIKKINKPKLIALDTMNLWISTAKEELLKAISMVDILFVNLQEAKMLTEQKTFIAAVNTLLTLGPKRVVVKLGELGATTATKDSRFFVPAYPCRDIIDPTGAGDSFAAGFMGSLAKSGDYSEGSFRKAMLYGTVMGSFTVENFSIDSYKGLTNADIEKRYSSLKGMISLEA